MILTVGRPRRDDGGPLRSWSKTTAPCWNYDEDDNGGLARLSSTVVVCCCCWGGLVKGGKEKKVGVVVKLRKVENSISRRIYGVKSRVIECELKVDPDSKRKKNCGWDRAR